MTAKRLISIVITLALAASLCVGAYAANAVEYPPYPMVEYQYTQEVTPGTVRYMSQNGSSPYFYADYWGKWSPKGECLTASISMALSYIGVDATPRTILDYGNGATNNYHGWGGSKYIEAPFAEAFNNYVNGSGRYSPPIVHLSSYSSGGHYVVVLGRISANTYQVADTNMDNLWTLTLNGSTASYDYFGTPKTDTIGSVMQYYIDNGGIGGGTPPQNNAKIVVFTIGKSTYTSGGAEKSTDTAPYIVGGYTYLPVYCVCAELGADVSWDAATKTVTLTKDGTVLTLVIGNDVMTVNGSPVQLATAPEVRNGRTCLPISPVTEAFGASIAWDGASRTVTITAQ